MASLGGPSSGVQPFLVLEARSISPSLSMLGYCRLPRLLPTPGRQQPGARPDMLCSGWKGMRTATLSCAYSASFLCAYSASFLWTNSRS